jgi:hypothetical protein
MSFITLAIAIIAIIAIIIANYNAILLLLLLHTMSRALHVTPSAVY